MKQNETHFMSFCRLLLQASLLIFLAFPIEIIAQNNFLKIYGDANLNQSGRTRIYNGNIYSIGQSGQTNEGNATFTKFDMNGNMIWQIELGDSTTLSDFTSFESDVFMLVGRTRPSSLSFNNRSIFSRIIDNGTTATVSWVRYYNENGREGFNRIRGRELNPGNVEYVILGANLISGANDAVNLYITDAAGNLLSETKYRDRDDQYSNGLIPDQNNGYTMFGNIVPSLSSSTQYSIYMTVDANMNLVEAYRYNANTVFSDALIFPSSGNKIMLGRTANNTGLITKIQAGGTVEWAYEMPGNTILYRIIGPYNNFTNKKVYFLLGKATVDGIVRTIVHQISISTIQSIQNLPAIPILEWSKYLDDGETLYNSAWIEKAGNAGTEKILYIDSRTNSPVGFGDHDLLLGVLNTALSSCMTVDQEYSLEEYSLTPTSIALPMTQPSPPDYDGVPWAVAEILSSDDPCACDPDETDPIFTTCPNDIMVTIGCESGAVVNYEVAAIDECSEVVISCSHPSGSTFPLGTTTVTCEAIDSEGNMSFCIFDVIISTNQAISAFCSVLPLNLSLDENCEATVSNLSSFITGISSCPFGFSQNPAIGTIITSNITATVTVFSSNGSTASCPVIINLLDDTDPTIECPMDINIQAPAGSDGIIVELPNPIVTDNCGPVTWTCDYNSGDFFPCGTTTVTCIAEDNEGNVDSCFYDVIVECPCPPVAGVTTVCDAPIDVLFIMDNSGSIDSGKFNDMVNITQSSINDIEANYSNAQYAVAHYGGLCGNRVSIEHDFTNSTTAQTITRQLSTTWGGIYPGNGDDLNASVNVIIDALSATPNPLILSPQSSLNLRAATNFIIVIYTDAGANPGNIPGSVSCSQPLLSALKDNSGGFTESNILKNNFDAKFTVVHFGNYAASTCAAIASSGGTYNGVVDNNIGDPSNGSIPRQVIIANNFTTTIDIIDQMPPCDSLVYESCCESLTANTTTTSPDSCCFSVDLANAAGPSIIKFEVEVLTPDWQFLSSSLQLGSGFNWVGVPTNQKLCINSGGSIPVGSSPNALEYCLTPQVVGAPTTQDLIYRWYEDQGGDTVLICIDTITMNCDIPPADPCVEIISSTIDCNPSNPYEYFFDFTVMNNSGINVQNIILEDLTASFGFSFCSTSFSAPAILIPADPNPLLPGDVSNVLCAKIVSPIPILSSTDVCFKLGLYDELNCCHSIDSFCVTLEPCCEVCDDISVSSEIIDVADGSCCYKLDIDNSCDYDLFTHFETEIITPGVSFGYHALGGPSASDWAISNSTPTSITWSSNSTTVPFGVLDDLIQFCLDDINDPSEIPQELVIRWYSSVVGPDSLICTDTLLFDCSQENECVLATEQMIECDTSNGFYNYSVKIKNNSSIPFAADDLYVTVVDPPDLVVTGIYPFSGPLNSGASETVNFPIFSTGSFPSTSSFVVLQYRLAFDNFGSPDTCCYENVLDTIPLPYCGSGPCLTDDLYLPDVYSNNNTYKTNGKITSDGQIAAGADISFKSSWEIDLDVGFEVELDAEFLATIEECPCDVMIINGDFENTTELSFTSDLNESCACQGSSFCLAPDARDKCANGSWLPILAPSGSGNFMIIDGSLFADIWSQDVLIVAGETYDFCFDYYPNVSNGGTPQLEVIVTYPDLSTESILVTSGTFNMWSNVCASGWTPFMGGTVTFTIVQNNSPTFSDYGIDNISLNCNDF